MFKKLNLLFIRLCCFISFTGCLLAEGKPATELNKTVRTDGLTGLNLFLANLYNNNRFMFAVISTLTIVILGVIVTYIVGLIIKPGHSSKEEI